ncbi:39S ribosomal protein L48, mitochondrial [Coccinella septempunctata]|uniref:39S ribosomal protein L48, mitochondrial n=1 Tax=Coccinella septempunctata TaxID=41139 RepID=UPI001D06B707|nr:39S ribosomal protein L48, mitochondrial [Coccinella septempunctata]
MIRILSRLCNSGVARNISGLRKFSNDLYEPDYLKELQPKFPIYETFNIQLKGYDYPILENYQRFVHKIADNMDIDVEDAWAIPAQTLQISTYKPQSEVVNSQYKLNLYERMIKIRDCTSLQLPILIRAIEASAPMGVTVNIIPHEPYHDEIRYIPDTELRQLKQELDDLGGPVKKK